MKSGQSQILRNIVSPYGLALSSYALFLFSILLPPSIYTGFIHEPDLMFLDVLSVTFFTLCTASFIAGAWVVGWVLPRPRAIIQTFSSKVPPAIFLLAPLSLCLLFTVISIVLIVQSNPLAVLILMSQKGNLLSAGGDASLELHGTMNISVLFVSGVVWWSVMRYRQFDTPWRGKRLVRAAQFLCVIAVLLFTSLILSKHLVIVLITGLAISYLVKKTFSNSLNWDRLLRTLLLFAGGGSLIFFFVSFLKGASDLGTQLDGFVGYSIAPYNRLAALLHGTLHFEYSRQGIYYSSFLSFNSLINRFIPFRDTFHLPDYYTWWWSEFDSVGRAGLNSSLIFFGTFGEIFLELGWLAPVYVFFYGALHGLVWHQMAEGRLIGIILYPYFAYCILFWFSTNGLFDQDIVALVIDACLLATYEYILKSRVSETSANLLLTC